MEIKKIPIYKEKGSVAEVCYYIVDRISVYKINAGLTEEGYRLRCTSRRTHPMLDIAVSVRDFDKDFKFTGLINVNEIE